MARSQPAGPSGAKQGQPTMQLRGHRAARREKGERDTWAMVYGMEDGQESTSRKLTPTEATAKQGEAQAGLALSTSSSANAPLGKTVVDNGPGVSYFQEVPAFIGQQPVVARFEHYFNAQGPAHLLEQPKSPVPRASSPHGNARQQSKPNRPTASAKTEMPKDQSAQSKSAKRKHGKRNRPEDCRESNENDGGRKKRAKLPGDAASTFYIGDFEMVQKFLYHRFDELTTKPLRTMVTAWIKILEPRRQSNYGPYHKQLASEQPAECTPPWWPELVPYNEPSHLSKHHLNELAVDVMLQHRKIDECKRRGSWVDKLRKAAEYAVETTPVEFFSSSKSLSFNNKMRERALTILLPSLFDVAQSYEHHITENALYEGSAATDPGNGREHTWQIISKPPREVNQRKYTNKSKSRPPRGTTYDAVEFRNESGVVPTNGSMSSRQPHVKTPKQPSLQTGAALRQSKDTLSRVAIAGQSTPPTPHSQWETYHPITIPNTSYPQSIDNRYLNPGLHVDIKGGGMCQQRFMFENLASPSGSLPHSESTGPSFTAADISPYTTDSPGTFVSGTSPIDVYNPILGSSYSSQMSHPLYGPLMVTATPGYSNSLEGFFHPLPITSHATGSSHEFMNDLDSK